jgi:ATP-binding protein involved in chromosome partitioning
MAVHVCTDCGYREHVFGSDGGKKLSLDYNVRTLASLPLDIRIREESDSGSPIVISFPDSEVSKCFEAAANEILETLKIKTERVDFPEIKISED